MDFVAHMTNAMREVYQAQEGLLRDEIKLCEEQVTLLHNAANISLPHTNEDGLPVVHGSRMKIVKLKEYWNQRRREACWRLRLMTGEDHLYDIPKEIA